MSDELPAVTTTTDGGVLTVTLNRPWVRNAIDAPTARLLTRALGAAPSHRAVVLKGSGTAFCAGGDVSAMRGVLSDDDGGVTRARVLAEAVHEAVAAVAASPVPTVAALHGVVAGGGIGLACACDIRIAANSCRLRLAFSSVGLSADSGTTFFLPRIVGSGVAADWLLRDPVITAAEANRVGFVTEVVDDETLSERAHDVASSLAMGPTLAFSRSRKRLDEAFGVTLAEHLAREADDAAACFATDDLHEGLGAFFDGRTARFTGR